MAFQNISSRQNKLIKDICALGDKDSRQSSKSFVTEGKTMLLEGINNGVIPSAVFIKLGDKEKNISKIESELAMIDNKKVPLYMVTNEVYDKLTFEKSPEGIMAVFNFLDNIIDLDAQVNIDNLTKKSENRFIILERLQDPGNVGSIIRCAVAFGFTGVILCGSADIYSPKTIRSTMGGLFKIPIYTCTTIDRAIDFIKPLVDDIIGAVLRDDAEDIKNVDFNKALCIIIGNEGSGLTSRAIELCTKSVIIPMQEMESINAAMAATIFIWEMKK